jgi:hypothetical protein
MAIGTRYAVAQGVWAPEDDWVTRVVGVTRKNGRQKTG